MYMTTCRIEEDKDFQILCLEFEEWQYTAKTYCIRTQYKMLYQGTHVFAHIMNNQ